MWREYGLTPTDLFGRVTPSQFLLLFTKAPGDAAGSRFDRLEALRQSNRERGERGQRPVFPSWL